MALKTLAVKDGLTGLANRRAFDEALEMEWSRALRTRKPLALLFADVDHFELLNHQHGHQVGDECLRTVATVIEEKTFRPTDLAVRYGGEEFAIIMPETDLEDARRVAERLCAAVMNLRITHGASGAAPWVTLNVGVATHIPGDDVGPDCLLGQADQAFYAAKHLGRNRVISTDTMLADFAKLHGRKMGERDLAGAVKR